MAESGETTVIAVETQIKGEMNFKGTARVFGTIDGKVVAKGDLHVAERGVCNAQIEADNVHVDGSIEGDVTATAGVQLNASSRVKGNIVAEKMITAEGAAIVGHVNIGPGAAKGAGRPGAESAQRGESSTTGRPEPVVTVKTTQPAGVK